MKKNSVVLYYLDVTVPFYYFYIVPVAIALIIISFDFSLYGLFPSISASSISSQHKFLNEFFALCNFFVMGLIFINYLRYPLSTAHVKQIRQHYAKLNKNQQSFNGWLGIVFLCFILGFINLSWFLIDDKPLPANEEWRRGDFVTYLCNFADPYISTFAISLKYVLIVILALMLVNALNTRKYRQ